MKKAYNQLMDEKRSQLCVALIESAQSDVKEARRKLVRYCGGRGAASIGSVTLSTCGNLCVQARKSKVSVDALPTTFEHDVKIETRKLFASIEHRRKKYEKGRKREDVRTRVSHALLTDWKKSDSLPAAMCRCVSGRPKSTKKSRCGSTTSTSRSGKRGARSASAIGATSPATQSRSDAYGVALFCAGVVWPPPHVRVVPFRTAAGVGSWTQGHAAG